VRVLPKLSFTVTVPADAPALKDRTAQFPAVGAYATVKVVAPALSCVLAPPTAVPDVLKPIARAFQAADVRVAAHSAVVVAALLAYPRVIAIGSPASAFTTTLPERHVFVVLSLFVAEKVPSCNSIPVIKVTGIRQSAQVKNTVAGPRVLDGDAPPLAGFTIRM
jgi:hypothetical protein